MLDEPKIIIFSDGACSGNPGPGGWAAIVLLPNRDVSELGGSDPATTNNRMEMQATLKALLYVKAFNCPVDFYTDSTYVIRGITQWIWGWRRNGWRTADGKDVSNKDIWQELAEVVQARGTAGKINWKYSRGHSGIPGNERCDEIAVAYSHREYIELYQGPLSAYQVSLLELPKDSSLPESKSSTERNAEKKVAFSYLSCVGGIVYRHKDWASCEKRVRGQSNAKFKKSKSADDEKEILKSWSLDVSMPIKE